MSHKNPAESRTKAARDGSTSWAGHITDSPKPHARPHTLWTNVLASLLIAWGVAWSMILFDAPTWAWLGVGLLVYLHEVKHPQ